MKFQKMLSSKLNNAALLAFTATTLFGLINAQAVGSKDLFRCRQSCYQKFVADWHHCMDFEDCKNMCITPPNINSYIPEAFSFLCWNNCDQQLGPFPLNINSALRQGSLVLTDIAWDQAITNASKQCLVTWEVSGGGLMGNLLTDSSTVELSLWPDTVYHVQVTCKHKETGGMRRSYKLIVDTHKLSDSTATGMQAIAMDTGLGKSSLPNIYANEQASSGETDSRMRILKDSSKDFLTPYNPNANVATSTKDTQSATSASSTSSSSTPASSSSSSSSSPSSSTTFRSVKPEDDAAHLNSVLRTKLTGRVHVGESLNFLTQSIVFAMIGSLVLFCALIVLYMLLRPVRKEMPIIGSAIDKEVLIQSEMLPSQTPSAMSAAAAARASSSSLSQSSITVVTAAEAALASADARTLHV